MSYDIEGTMKNADPGVFHIFDARILCIAAKCSCSREFYGSGQSEFLIHGVVFYSRCDITQDYVAYMMELLCYR